METLKFKKMKQWLLPAVLILFILEIITLPMVMGITYSGRSDSPDHTLTYTKGKLAWDANTDTFDNGAAGFDLFEKKYIGAESSDEDNIVAPGTEGKSIVRLHNKVKGAVDYTAVLYWTRTSEELPVMVSLNGDKLKDAKQNLLPPGIQDNQIIRTVEGKVKGGELQDFDVDWIWNFEEDAQRNQIDTMLGNKEELDSLSVGLYIVVEDNNNYVQPETGDDSYITMYMTLMGISFAVLLVLLLERRKEKHRNESI